MRNFSKIISSKMDSLVKDIVASILSTRKVGYLDNRIKFHKNIGYDFEAGFGKHTYLYKFLVDEKRYRTDMQLQSLMRDFKRRKVDIVVI